MEFIINVLAFLLLGLAWNLLMFILLYDTFMENYLNEEGKKKFRSILSRIHKITDKIFGVVTWFIEIDKPQTRNCIITGENASIGKIFVDNVFNGIIENAVLIDNSQQCKDCLEKEKNICCYLFENIRLTDKNMTKEEVEESIKGRLYAYLKNEKLVQNCFTKEWIRVIYRPSMDTLEIILANKPNGISELKDMYDNEEDEDYIDIFSEEPPKHDIMNFAFRLDDFTRYKGEVGVNLPVSSHCHLLLTGSSGTGKSTAAYWLLTNFLSTVPNKVFVADFKGNREWKFLSDYPNYYAGKECLRGLREYYAAFTKAKEKDGKVIIHHLLILEEYSAMINYLTMEDKLNKTKYAVEAQSIVSEILSMGRSIGFGLWIIAQRPDASLFANGARDNFMVVVSLGNISKEHRRMVCNGYELPSERVYKTGEGILYADGLGVVEVKYPFLEDLSNWKATIFRLLMQDFLEDAKGIGE